MPAHAPVAKRAVESATLQLYNIKQEKALAARKAWRSASAGFKRIEVTRNSVLLNEEAFEQERARYGSGLVPYRSLLEAHRLRPCEEQLPTINYRNSPCQLDSAVLMAHYSLATVLIGMPSNPTHNCLRQLSISIQYLPNKYHET